MQYTLGAAVWWNYIENKLGQCTNRAKYFQLGVITF